MFNKIKVCTIRPILNETKYNIDDVYFNLNSEELIDVLDTNKVHQSLEYKTRKLSIVDKKLLDAANEFKKSCILVTDDRALRHAAKLNNINTYTTPTFLVYLCKQGIFCKEEIINLLDKLKNIYVRKKEGEKMSSTIEINLPKYIRDYVGAKARNNYIPEPIVVEQYVLKAVLEELVLKYHKKGYSYSKIAELTHSSVPKVLEILAEHNVEDELNDLEQDLKELGI